MNKKVLDTKSIVLSPDLSSIKCKTFPLRPTQVYWLQQARNETHPRNNFAIVQELVHTVCCAPARVLSGWSSVSSASNNGSDNPVCVSDGQPAWIEEPLLPGPCWRDKNYRGNDNDAGPCHLSVSMISPFSISPKPFDFSVQHQTLWTRATSVIMWITYFQVNKKTCKPLDFIFKILADWNLKISYLSALHESHICTKINAEKEIESLLSS